MYRSSASGKFPRLANLNASSMLFRVVRIQGIMIYSSTSTLRTCPFLLTPMLRSYKDNFAGNTVHVYASIRFEIVEMDKTVFCYEVDDAMLLRYRMATGKSFVASGGK
jgi:hypothetical protein